jgi:hypothetical protein
MGFEPTTFCLEGRRSTPELHPHFLSGRPDLNWGPLEPKSSALTGLRYAPNQLQVYRKDHPASKMRRSYRNTTSPCHVNTVAPPDSVKVSATSPRVGTEPAYGISPTNGDAGLI